MKNRIVKLCSALLAALMLLTCLPAFSLTADAAGTTISTLKVGDIFSCGYWPQTRITDSSMIDTLNSALDQSVRPFNFGFIDNEKTIPMMYADVTVSGSTYRAVNLGGYRPINTSVNADTNLANTIQDDNGYTVGGVYWFKWEPVKWQIIRKASTSAGVAYSQAITVKAVDAQPYDEDAAVLNFWKSCSIKGWIDNRFITQAFTPDEKASLMASSVTDNGGKVTGNMLCLPYSNDMVRASSGFNTNPELADKKRTAAASDYALCMGANKDAANGGTSFFVLGNILADTDEVKCVTPNGTVSSCGSNAIEGVRLCGYFVDSSTPVTAAAKSTVSTTRLAGSGRTQTAADISRATFVSAENVVVASGDTYADALSGVSLAAALNAPILLIRNSYPDQAFNYELKRLGAKNVYILGGEGVIYQGVADDLTAAGYTVERIAGNTRYETAVKIAEKLKEIKGAPSEVFFAYSYGFADALSVSSVSGINGAPVLYINKDGELDDATSEFLTSCGAAKASIVGGTGVVGEAAEGNIAACGVAPESISRLYGNNRYETCQKVIDAYAPIFSGKSICLATGNEFPDALAGGVFCAKIGAPLMLVGSSLSDAQAEALSKSNTIKNIFILGGGFAVPETVVGEVVSSVTTAVVVK